VLQSIRVVNLEGQDGPAGRRSQLGSRSREEVDVFVPDRVVDREDGRLAVHGQRNTPYSAAAEPKDALLPLEDDHVVTISFDLD
jgi:hypothetical protein